MQVTSNNESIIQVQSPQTVAQAPNVAHYPVTLHDTSMLWGQSQQEVSVAVWSGITGQEQMVPVRVKLIGDRPEALTGKSFAAVCL